MNFTGKLEGLKMDYATKKQSISVEVNEDARDAFQELKDCEKLDIQIKKHREKRSLDANAYYWVLITKFAKKLELSNPEAHNMCLIRYGYPVILSGKSACATIPDTEEAENKVKNSTEYHLQPTSQVREGVDGVMYRTYRLLRGSRTYNTEEMSRLISGLITMCKEAQIPDREIATPEEKRLLKERYAEYAKDLESWLDGTEIKAVIVDPAAASFIAELRKRGFRVIKAKNDVEDGIRLVSTKLNLIKIIFSNVCQNTIKEFASYIWDAKAAERGEDKPIKQYDHAMDAVRYFVYTIFGDKPRLNRNLKGGL